MGPSVRTLESRDGLRLHTKGPEHGTPSWKRSPSVVTTHRRWTARGFRVKTLGRKRHSLRSGATTHWRDVSARVVPAEGFPAGWPGRRLQHREHPSRTRLHTADGVEGKAAEHLRRTRGELGTRFPGRDWKASRRNLGGLQAALTMLLVPLVRLSVCGRGLQELGAALPGRRVWKHGD